MTVTARGIYAEPVSILRTMLSNCASFQKLVKAANAAGALSSILQFGQSSDATRPFALIELGDVPREAISQARFKPAGQLKLALEMPLKWEAAVTAQTSASVFRCSTFANLANDFFNGLRLKMLAGDQINQADDVSDFAGATGEITLATGLPGAPGVGSTLRIYPSNVDDALLWFMNVVGDIQTELEALSGQGGYFNIHSIRMGDYGRPTQEDREDDYAGCVLEISYGV